MNRKTIVSVSTLLLASITVFGVLSGFGNRKIAMAASLESHNESTIDSADSSPYRHEVLASNYISGQVWTTNSAIMAEGSDVSGAVGLQLQRLSYPTQIYL